MTFNILFVLGAVFVAWVLGHLLDLVLEHFIGGGASQPESFYVLYGQDEPAESLSRRESTLEPGEVEPHRALSKLAR